MSDEPPTDEAKLSQLKNLVVAAAQKKVLVDELEEQLKAAKKALETFEEKLIPDLMSELDIRVHETRGGLRVEYVEEWRGSFPKNPEKQERAFEYLEKTQNQGLVKQEIKLNFDRETSTYADMLMELLHGEGKRVFTIEEARAIFEAGVYAQGHSDEAKDELFGNEWEKGESPREIAEHAEVSREQTINHMTLKKFAREELEEGREIPLDAFGVYVQKVAKVVVKKGKK